MERQFAHADSVGTADVLGVALEGDSANVQVLQVRDGVLQDRQSFFLDAAGAEDEDTVLVQFAYEFYSLALAIPPLVVVAQDERRGRGARGRCSASGAAARRGARGRARRQAQAGRAGRRATRASPSTRTAAATSRRAGGGAMRWPTCRRARPAGAPGADRVLRHLQPRRDLRRGVDGRLRGRRAGRRPTTAPSPCATTAARTTSRACEEALRRRFSRLAGPGEDDPSFAAPPGPRGDRRRQGPAGGGARGHARTRGSRTCRS